MATALNLDVATVLDFGEEWSAFDQSDLPEAERRRRFDEYFSIFPLSDLKNAEGFDLGCGSGRWASMLAPLVGRLHCIDPAEAALDVARRNLADQANVNFHLADASTIPLSDRSQDFGVCLGVIHHVPDPQAALTAAVAKLRPGAPFLLYLYYDFENRPLWFRLTWRASDFARRLVCGLPVGLKRPLCAMIATAVYWPLARASYALERAGRDVSLIPLSHYRNWSFYSMRTDALDRFGTRIERRFSRGDIEAMMCEAGLDQVRLSAGPPYWVAVGTRRQSR